MEKCGTPMPWVRYTHISHTNPGKKDNSIVIISDYDKEAGYLY